MRVPYCIDGESELLGFARLECERPTVIEEHVLVDTIAIADLDVVQGHTQVAGIHQGQCSRQLHSMVADDLTLLNL
jgi:hypothetical protein